jgi:UDP-glucose 4-epimerase
MVKMKVLVTGGAGFIGSHTVEALINERYEVIVIDNFSTGRKAFLNPNVRLYKMDITSPQVEDVFVLEKPDYIIHLAAQIDVTKSIQNPAKDANDNILGTIRLLTCSEKYKVKKFIFSSSCAVYGDAGEMNITESFPVNPLSFYGISKLTSELYINLFHRLFGLSFTILRYANVYGPRQALNGEGGVIALFTQKLVRGEVPLIYGDGEQSRDFVYVKDVAAANVKALFRGQNELINIGLNQTTTINQLIECINSITPNPISPRYLPRRLGDIQHSQLNNNKATEQLGWIPAYGIKQGLEETFRYYLSHFSSHGLDREGFA